MRGPDNYLFENWPIASRELDYIMIVMVRPGGARHIYHPIDTLLYLLELKIYL